MNQSAKLPPHDQGAEEAVIGSLLIDGESYNQIKKILQPIHFYYEKNGWMYGACVELNNRHEAIDQVTLAQELARVNKLDQCGGAAYLSHLISTCGSPLDITHYAEIVRRLAVARGLINLSDKIAQEGYSSSPDTNASIDAVLSWVKGFQKQNTLLDNLVTPADVGDKMLNLITRYNGGEHSLSWGFRDLDEITTGIYPGEFIIIGGRPSVGKTQIMLDAAEMMVNKGCIVLFVSAEMTLDMLMERKLSRELCVPVKVMRRHGLTEEQQDKLVELSGKLAERTLYYLPQGVSSQEVYASAQRLKDTKGLDIVFVDYLGILRDAYSGYGENLNAKVGYVCKILKSVATDMNIPVVCGCQLSRAVELREEKVPMLSDLRDSGNIEQDADVVFLLHRTVQQKSVLEVMMAKHRQLGSVSEPVRLVWHEKAHRYVDGAKEERYV
jgi:replicative DNA helicase